MTLVQGTFWTDVQNENQCTKSMFSVLQGATFARGKLTRDLSNFIPALGVTGEHYMRFKSEAEMKNIFQLEPIVTPNIWKGLAKMHPLTITWPPLQQNVQQNSLMLGIASQTQHVLDLHLSSLVWPHQLYLSPATSNART